MEGEADKCLVSITERKRGKLARESPSRCMYVCMFACMHM